MDADHLFFFTLTSFCYKEYNIEKGEEYEKQQETSNHYNYITNSYSDSHNGVKANLGSGRRRHGNSGTVYSWIFVGEEV